MNCFKCQAENVDSANFCSNCGRQFNSKTSGVERKKPRAVQDGLSKADMDGLSKIRLNRKVRAISAGLVGFVFAGGMMIYLLNAEKTIIKESPILMGLPVLIFAVLVFLLLLYCRQISRAEYESLPGAIGTDGQHRCIFCGHRGIYRHGQYRSNQVWNDCSMCGRTLYMSSKGLFG